MNLYNFLIDNKYNIIWIIIYIIIFLIVYGLIYTHYNLAYITNNWEEYRCKPYIMFISGFIKKDNELGILESCNKNVKGCFWNKFKEYFTLFTKPFILVINQIIILIKSITHILDNLRGQIKVIRNLILGITIGVMKKIENTTNATIFAYTKIYDILKRQSAIYENMVNTMQTTSVLLTGLTKGTMGTMMNMSEWAIWAMPIFTLGPAGAIFPATMMCFSPNTLINNIPISELKLGDLIDNNTNKILSIHKHITIDYLYNYNNIYVSGNHLVFEDNKFIKVIDSNISKYTDYKPKYVYNISTSNFIININNIIFSDYDENLTSEIENTMILNLLNNSNNITNNKLINKRYRTGLVNIVINSNDVVGYSSHLILENDIFYRIGNTICGEYTILFYNNKWINARDIGTKVAINTNNNYIQYYTNSGYFIYNNIKWYATHIS